VSRHAALVLPSRSDVPRRARSFLRRQFVIWGWTGSDPAAGLLDDALLALSELATNAVRHGKGDVEVVIECHGGQLLLQVHDAGAAPVPLEPVKVPLTSMSGRGLTIVAALSTSWGVTVAPLGKTVWCRLAVAAGSCLGGHDPQVSGRPSRIVADDEQERHGVSARKESW
jgi:anti-sigma regulatory factor (Ser/Thr protein kinase)